MNLYKTGKRYTYATIGIGAVIAIIGTLLVIRDYDLKQSCSLNRVPCPNFAFYNLFGTFSIVAGVIILSAGIMVTFILRAKNKWSNLTV